MFPDRQQMKLSKSLHSIGPIAKFLGFEEFVSEIWNL